MAKPPKLLAPERQAVDTCAADPQLAVLALARAMKLEPEQVVRRLAESRGDATLLGYPRHEKVFSPPKGSSPGRPPVRSRWEWERLRDDLRRQWRELGSLRKAAVALNIPRASLQRELARSPMPPAVVAMPAGLSERHAVLLAVESGVSPEVAAARGYRTSAKRGDLEIPIWNQTGPQWNQYRADHPRSYRNDGRARPIVDVPPAGLDAAFDASRPLWVTESPRKADAAVSAGLACVDFPGTGMVHSSTLCPEAWHGIPLQGRAVILAFDRDATWNPHVMRAEREAARFLASRGATVKVVRVPEVKATTTEARDLKKAGLDDYFGAGGTVERLLRAAQNWSDCGPVEIPAGLEPPEAATAALKQESPMVEGVDVQKYAKRRQFGKRL